MQALYAITSFVALLLALTIVPQVQAEPAEPTTIAENQMLDMPHRGLTMAQVEQKYGAPKEKIAAVGEPPIARWIYTDYTVYFEGQFVVHAVKDKKISSLN